MIILVVTVVLTIGCKEGVYNVGGYNFQIKMPKIALSPTEQPEKPVVAYLWLVANPMEPTPAPRIRTSNPLFDIKLGVKSGETIQPIRDVRLFSIVVPDLAFKEPPRIVRHLEISLPSRPLKIIKGPDLDKEFGLFYRGGQFLVVKQKEVLPTPILGRDDLDKVPRIKGTVAQFVAEDFAPITTEEYSIIPQQAAPILKVPITISSNEEENINQVEIGVDWPNSTNPPIFWLTPGELFPSPLIETNVDFTPPKIFLVQNVEVQTEYEILAPPSSNLPPLPSVLDLCLFYQDDEIELGMGNKNIIIKNPPQNSIPQNSGLKQTTTWGKIKKN